MPWVYVLECRDGSLYAGSTPDLDVRLFQHQQGIGSVYTARRRPVRLVFSEFTESMDEASRWERQIKGWRREKKLALIRREYEALVELSQRYVPNRP